MTCKHCGAPISDGAKFCENCGNQVVYESSDEMVQETVNTEPERVEAEVVNPMPESDSSTADMADESMDKGKGVSKKGSNSLAIASLVCGILGLVCCCCGFFGLLLSIAGIVLGVISIKQEGEGQGMAIAGIVCGGIGALITIIAMALGTASSASGLLSGNPFENIEDFLDSL